MKALDFSVLSGSLVVRKNIAGDVCISTQPPITISDDKLKVVAVGADEVRKCIAKTNIKELVDNRVLLVVC
jgi:hypothetical protein